MNATVPPCVGQSELFDSTDLLDHRQARALCNNCPMLDACRTRLELTIATAHEGMKYGPRGTWAGELLGPPQTAAHRAQAEEVMFNEAEARKAHADYAAGFRDPRTVVGERVYNRRKKRQQHERKRVA